jgi:oligopeptidase A
MYLRNAPAVAASTTVLPLLPEDRFLCSFGHIFAGGYAAGYYSYKWAEILSADAFAAFEEAGLQEAETVASTGRRYRDTILALGGSRHPMGVFREFRGRQPTTAALLRHAGLAA